MNQQYELIIRGHLPPQWTSEFENMQITTLPDGTTRISGSLPDQSALYGLLMRLRDFGLSLVAVNAADPKDEK